VTGGAGRLPTALLASGVFLVADFAFLFRNSVRAVDLFNLPPPNFLEIGRQIEI
jgi:hypothetical protein